MTGWKLLWRMSAVVPLLVLGVALGAPSTLATAVFGPAAAAPAVLVAAGDIASCSSSGDEATAALLDAIPGTVAAIGDTVYEDGTAAEYASCYAPNWGRHKARTRPAAGNHEYQTTNASGYYGYFGSAAGDPSKGYYSYNLGAWHIVVLNSECWAVGGCQKDSAQEQWLRADLAANPVDCTLAYFHHPRFSSGPLGNHDAMKPFWQALYDADADVVLSGHDHIYERFAPQNPNGGADAGRGMRQFVVGTGGKDVWDFTGAQANSQVRNGKTFGVLKLTLDVASYSWEFVPVAGSTFTDSGSDVCHQDGPRPTATPTRTSTATPSGAGANLIRNPSFETDLNNWFGYQSTLSRVSGGQSGSWAAKSTLSCACTYFTLDDTPASVANPRQGDLYSADAWVKAAGATGKQARLVIRESGGATGAELTASTVVTLSGSWQRLSVSRSVARADRAGLEVYVVQLGATSGDAFLMDNVSLTRGSGGTGTPTPSPTPTRTATPSPTATRTATPTATPTSGNGGANLVRNPSFETDLTAWYGYQSALTRVSGGQSGSWSARVAVNCACTFSTLDDAPATVATPLQGETYTARAWVKDSSGTGRQVRIVLRETGGATASESSVSAAVTLSGSWQQISVTRAVARTDRAALEVYLSQDGAAGGNAFLVDNVSVVKQ